MKKLAIITLNWNSEVEKLIHLTKDSFQLKIFIATNSSFNFTDDKIEILQFINLENTLSIFKILPVLIFHEIEKVHFINTPNKTKKEKYQVQILKSILKSFPLISWTESSTFLNSSLNLNQNENQNQCLIQQSNYVDANENENGNENQILIPLELSKWQVDQNYYFLKLLEANKIFESEVSHSAKYTFFIQGWGNFKLNQKNIWRSNFKNYLNQIYFYLTPKTIKNKIGIFVIAGLNSNLYSELELINWVQKNYYILADENQLQNLQGPWKKNKNIFVINNKMSINNFVDFFKTLDFLRSNNFQPQSTYQTLKDYFDNQTIRTIFNI